MEKVLNLEPSNWVLPLALLTLTGCVTLGKSLGLSEPSFHTVKSICVGLGGRCGLASGKVLCELKGAGG